MSNYIRKTSIARALLASALLALTGTSCMMYHPHNVDIPMLHEQGDLRVDGSASLTLPLLDGSGMNATVSYAPLNHLGLLISGSVTDPQNCYAHAAVGTFWPFGKSVLECYVGAATGHSEYTQSGNNTSESTLLRQGYYVSGPYNIVFGQLNFGWNNLLDDLIDIGVGLRGGALKPDWRHVDIDDEGAETLVDHKNSPLMLFEPQLVFRIGGEHVKMGFNVAYSLIPDWPTDNNYYNYSRFSVAIGLNYHF